MADIVTTPANRSFQQLLNTTRRFLGDTSTNTSNQRWSDHEILEAIGFEISKMALELGIMDGAGNAENTTMTYTANATSVAHGVNGYIYKIQDETDSATLPRVMDHGSFFDLEKIGGGAYDQNLGARYVWTNQGYANIAVRPIPSSARTLRLFYMRGPYFLAWDSTSDDDLSDEVLTDQHVYLVSNEELICLGAALRLKRVDGEATEHERLDYIDLWDRFRAGARLNRGPAWVRNNRRWS